uniref:(northern house mosquito) hypothetical protein n=1 Tax=Culex pipiens TaxID=7175 RepID=A0A8D8E7K1_CULPI
MQAQDDHRPRPRKLLPARGCHCLRPRHHDLHRPRVRLLLRDPVHLALPPDPARRQPAAPDDLHLHADVLYLHECQAQHPPVQGAGPVWPDAYCGHERVRLDPYAGAGIAEGDYRPSSEPGDLGAGGQSYLGESETAHAAQRRNGHGHGVRTARRYRVGADQRELERARRFVPGEQRRAFEDHPEHGTNHHGCYQHNHASQLDEFLHNS